MRVSTVSLHHQQYGTQGAPLVILHGLFGSLDNWQTLARRFSEAFRVFTLDQRNHGKSPHTGQMDYPAMAEDLAQWLDAQHLESAFLIGHSMGGKTVMEFAQRYPDRTDALVVADIAPRAYTAGHDFILEVLRDFPVEEVRSRKQAEQWMAEYLNDPAIRRFLLKNLARVGNEQYQWKMNLPVILQEYHKLIDGVQQLRNAGMPALFAYGERSGYIATTDYALIRQYFPQAHFVGFPNTGHWLHAEQPDLFYQTALDFLKPLA